MDELVLQRSRRLVHDKNLRRVRSDLAHYLMQVQQPRHHSSIWPNKLPFRGARKQVATGHDLASRIKFGDIEGYRSQTKFGLGLLVDLVTVVDDDVPGRNVHPAMPHISWRR